MTLATLAVLVAMDVGARPMPASEIFLDLEGTCPGRAASAGIAQEIAAGARLQFDPTTTTQTAEAALRNGRAG